MPAGVAQAQVHHGQIAVCVAAEDSSEPAHLRSGADTAVGAAVVDELNTTSEDSKPAASSSAGYLQHLTALHGAWKDCPPLTIAFRNLSVVIRDEHTIADAQNEGANDKQHALNTNLARALVQFAGAPVRLAQSAYRAATRSAADPRELLAALAPANGVITPGTMTLVIGPPGAGKSTLLRALSARVDPSQLRGEIQYNGLTPSQCAERGVRLTRMAAYVGQSDVDFATLTVQETLEFAHHSGSASVALLDPSAALIDTDSKRTEHVLAMLGLTECRHTVVGSESLRGISGGQRRRCGLGEALMLNARLLALDNVSTGLDSLTTLRIFSVLKEACAVNHSSVVSALQQVTPETYALFDQVILMREGHILYHGPREGIRGWLRDVMRVPFIPESIEEAGFLVQLLSDPKAAFEAAHLAWKVSGSSLGQIHEERAGVAVEPDSPEESVSESASTEDANENDDESSISGCDIQRVHSPLRLESISSHEGDMAPVKPQPASSPVPRPTPFKLAAAQLEILCDLDQLVASNRRSVYASVSAACVDEAFADRSELASKLMDVPRWSSFTHSQFGRRFPHSTARHTLLSLRRQSVLLRRNYLVFGPRMISAVLMACVYGSLYWNVSTTDFASRMGAITDAIMFLAFANLSELSFISESKSVISKQLSSGLAHPLALVCSTNLTMLPLALIETLLFGTIVYFAAGFELAVSSFVFFLLCLFSISSAVSQLFRFVAYTTSAEVGYQLNMNATMLFVVFGGFLLPRDQIASGLVWIYYASPFSWMANAIALSEFSAPTFDAIDASTGGRQGDAYLRAFGMHTDRAWMGFGVGVMWLIYLLGSIGCLWALNRLRPQPSVGAKRPVKPRLKKPLKSVVRLARTNAEGKQMHVEITIRPEVTSTPRVTGSALSTVTMTTEAASGLLSAAALAATPSALSPVALAPQPKQFSLSSLPFTPATLSWKDLSYSVSVGQKEPRVLLNHISGYAQPGQLTALMGSSGAGKTTLLETLASRKTVGTIVNADQILINGAPKSAASSNLLAYVEQQNLHLATATVREALEFSAKLRLPSTVDSDTRHAFVFSVMELVGLTNVANRIVGNAAAPSLSSGQLKLLTIAVELVANPSILFLDEPTSGLDSETSLRIMSVLQRIAATGRTIVCTIHQPSQEVFSMFDRLLLLKRGGEVVYFDEIGVEATTLIGYLSAVSNNAIPYTPLVAPANWMLDIIALDSAKISAADTTALDLAEAWRCSEQAAAATRMIELLSTPMFDSLNSPVSSPVLSQWTRLCWVTRRLFVSHWRSPSLNLSRCGFLFVLGLALGCIYFQSEVRTYAGMTSLLGAIFLGICLPSSIGSQAALSSFYAQRPIVTRERSVGMYGPLCNSISMSIVELPFLFVGTLCFLVPFYTLVGLAPSVAGFSSFLLPSFLLVLFFHSFDQLLLSWSPSLTLAQSVGGASIDLLWAFGGCFIKPHAIPSGWRWFYLLDPIPKAFVSSMLSQVQCSESASSSSSRIDGCRMIDAPNVGRVQLEGYVSQLLDGDAGSAAYWRLLGWLCLTIVLVRSAAFVMCTRTKLSKR